MSSQNLNHHSRLIVPLVAACLSLPLPLLAQTKEISIEKTELQGTIIHVTPREFQMRGVDSKTYRVDVQNSGIDIAPAMIHFDFEESQKSLKKGMNVRFEAAMDGRKVKGKVNQVEVLGAVADADYGRTPIHDFRTESSEDGERSADRYLIVGRILRDVRGTRTLSVEIPRTRGRLAAAYRAKLTDDAKVVVRSIMFAKPGQGVKVAGETQVGGDGLLVWATQVHVTGGASREAVTDRAGESECATELAVKADPDTAAVEEAAGESAKEKVEYEGKILRIN